MALNEINRASVLQAIEEFDRLGRDPFLKKYGYRASRSYFLVHDGTRYDSKAIAGVAHGYARPDLGPLTRKQFTGGETVVVPRLKALGFDVKSSSTRNPNWTRDELILALDYYLKHPGESHDDALPGIVKLSQEINAVGQLLGHATSETFRNPNGVSMKLLNFRANDPAYIQTGRVGLSRGNKLEKELWDEFAHDLPRLKVVAASIRAWLDGADEAYDAASNANDEPEIAEASEGRILTRLHRYRERDRSIIKRKKDSVHKAHGRLFCEACSFDFLETYGERGAGFIECHHTKPISEMSPGAKTKLADLALLCANCHRIVHVRSPWLTIDQLKAILSER